MRLFLRSWLLVVLVAGCASQEDAADAGASVSLDVEGSAILCAALASRPSSYLFAANTPDGEVSLRWDAAVKQIKLRVRGVDVVQTKNGDQTLQAAGGPSNLQAGAGDRLGFRAWYYPSGGARSAGVRVDVNGVLGYDSTAEASGAALALSNLHFGNHPSLATAGPIVGSVSGRQVSGGTDAEAAVSGVVLGDSIVAARYSDDSASAFITTLSRSAVQNGTRVLSLALAGAKVADQTAAWQACYCRGNATVKWVAIVLGINDLNAGRTTAQIVTSLQALVDDIGGSTPSASILLGTMTPWTALTGASLATWREVNDAIAGLGPTPITGVHARVTSHTATMADASDDLLAQYDGGDGLHLNTSGRAVIGNAYRTALVALGLL